MRETLTETNFKFDGALKCFHGKVRDVYFFKDLVSMVVTDRISAFDRILPKGIPFKGEVLNKIAAYQLEATKDIVPNWLIDVPDPMVTVGKCCKPYKLEMIIRGYIAGSAWRAYEKGAREICGVKLPEGLKENQRLPQPIITPTTKADSGHDENISREEIIAQGIVSEAEYKKMEEYTYKLFDRGQQLAHDKGLILVDTKYEFGNYNGEVTLIDEIHTPDSSRYFYLEGYEERFRNGEPQKQLSKEFVREWLMAKGFSGNEGEKVPEMTDDFVLSVSERYIELYEKMTGKHFEKSDNEPLAARIERNMNTFFKHHKA